MGVLQRLGFGGKKKTVHPGRPVEVPVSGGGGASANGALEPSDDEAILEARADFGPDDSSALRPVRNKQELVAELQRNYHEVLELVRKFDQHLDARARREEELTRLVESAARSAEALPQLRDEQVKLREAMGQLIEITRDGIERNESMGAEQRDAIERAAQLLENTADREGEVADALEGVRQSMGQVVGVNENLAETLERGRVEAGERQEEFATALKKSQSIAVTAVAISAGMVVVAVVMALVVLTR